MIVFGSQMAGPAMIQLVVLFTLAYSVGIYSHEPSVHCVIRVVPLLLFPISSTPISLIPISSTPISSAHIFFLKHLFDINNKLFSWKII